MERRVPLLDHEARQPNQDNLYAADSVHTTPRSVHILGADANPYDLTGKFPERPSELAANVGSIVGAEIALRSANVSWDRNDV